VPDCLRIDSPAGPLGLAADGHGLRRIQFHAPADLAWAGAGARWGGSDVLQRAREQLEAYFEGRLRAFDLPLAPAGTAFQRQVWAALATIPWGQTRSYGELAAAIGRPGSARAVGAANGRNPLPIVVPCHRVIGADGSLTGFGGGLPAKRHLLQLEGWRAA